MGTIKAVSNLLLGSVSGLKNENISITDTNGHVYNSLVDAQSEMLARLQENDKYMQEKVQTQLNRLIGQGKYVATVSTFLKQAPVEKFTIEYDPQNKLFQKVWGIKLLILIKILMLLVYIFQMVYRQGVLIHLKIEAIQELRVKPSMA